MKKNLLSLLLLFAATISFTCAQTVVFSDNFDSYTAGSHLAQTNSAWTTWNNAPGTAEDGTITNTQAASMPNSLLITGTTDQVLSLGNYNSGHYTIAFNMYIPTGYTGYFNIQQVLLQKWALGCYFYAGTIGGYLRVGGEYYSFNYPTDEWFPILFDADLDNDMATLTINDTIVNSWTFHYAEESTTTGINQLAGIDFYSNALGGIGSCFYLDDIVVTEVTAGTGQDDEFVVNPNTLDAMLAPNSTATLNITLSNPGTAPTEYSILTTYDIPNPDTTSTGGIFLKYSIDSVQAIGFLNALQYEVAIGFPSSSLQSYIGQTLQYICFLSTSEITNAKIRVYDMTHPILKKGPGDVIYEQAFVPIDGWNYVQLDTTIVIDGRDLWFGFWIDQPDSVYPIFLDTHPANDYSAWYKTEYSGWINKFSGYENNLAIYGFIDGTPITPWLSTNPNAGTIPSNGSVTVHANFQSTGMNIGENHTAKIHCYSSDFDNREQIIPVSMEIIGVSVNEHSQIEVKLYPNPTSDYLQVSSDMIERVEIHNMLGQKVFDKIYSDTHIIIPTSSMVPGTYAVTVTSGKEKVTKQIVVK